ncbi:MAG: hypothetical protein H0V82_08870 [Candidatus Protochlamydia sp.]|nr:hypothetical protein [Candidatus Protochlamydia sp.]
MLFIALIVLTIYCRKLANRIKQCELILKQLEQALLDEEQPAQQELNANASFSSEAELACEKSNAELLISPPGPIALWQEESIIELKKDSQAARKPSKFFGMIKENWMGAFGSFTLVMGAVFFGLTSTIMQHPEARVGILFLASLLILGISQKINAYKNWSLLCGWLRSIAGSVILFAALGAGSIEGLKFIQTPSYALIVLCAGIAFNLSLACTTAVQSIASLHVILSLIAFCIVPQTIILLPLGALISIVGLFTAYRSRWDLHLFFIVLAFACLNTVWTYSLLLTPLMHYLAIACSVKVGLTGAAIHYSKKYQMPHFKAVPLAAHILNWLLLIWNLLLHAQFFSGTPFILGTIAMAGFILARNAKRKGIHWLYYTDTLLSQILLLSAIASCANFSVSSFDLSTLFFVEIILFNFICIMQKEDFLLKAGYCLQFLIVIIALSTSLIAIENIPGSDKLPIYLRMGLLTAMCWGFHLIGSKKKWPIDDIRLFFLSEKHAALPYSITAVMGTAFFLSIHLFGFGSAAIQTIVLLIIGVVGFWRKKNEDQTWNIIFTLSLIVVHLSNMGMLLEMFLGHKPGLFLSIKFAGLALLDTFLIFGNLLQFRLWDKNFSPFMIYVLGLFVTLYTFIATSPLIPGLLFLGYSIIALRAAGNVPKSLEFSADLKFKISESMTRSGLAFLGLFIMRFVAVNLYNDVFWNGISVRWITEGCGIFTLLYWTAYFPKNACGQTTRLLGHVLNDISLAFITFCLMIEFPEGCAPLIAAAGAIGLLLSAFYYQGPIRLAAYSWIYLIASIIQVGLLSKPGLMHAKFAWPAIVLQLCYAIIIYKKQNSIENFMKTFEPSSVKTCLSFIYRQWNLAILCPIFLAIAFELAVNFEKTILTLLWVGLTCIYLCTGLILRSKEIIKISMFALFISSLRLLLWDSVQTDLPVRALVFIGVGAMLLGMSVLYKKFKHRLEVKKEASLS